MAKVLMLYGTREGHTRKITTYLQEQLTQQLAEQNISAPEFTIINLAEVAQTPLCLTDYQAVIIGASIHYGYFPNALMQFIKQHQAQLQQLPTFFFGINLIARKPEKNTPETNVYVRKFLAKSPVKFTGTAVFAGALNYSMLNFFDRHIIRFIMWMTKGETALSTNKVYTDWNAVDKFATQIISAASLNSK